MLLLASPHAGDRLLSFWWLRCQGWLLVACRLWLDGWLRGSFGVLLRLTRARVFLYRD